LRQLQIISISISNYLQHSTITIYAIINSQQYIEFEIGNNKKFYIITENSYNIIISELLLENE